QRGHDQRAGQAQQDHDDQHLDQRVPAAVGPVEPHVALPRPPGADSHLPASKSAGFTSTRVSGFFSFVSPLARVSGGSLMGGISETLTVRPPASLDSMRSSRAFIARSSAIMVLRCSIAFMRPPCSGPDGWALAAEGAAIDGWPARSTRPSVRTPAITVSTAFWYPIRRI